MSLTRNFRNPPNEYRIAPFWFWNHELKLEELERQIMEMKEKGFGGFIMHARHGLLTPYMGEEWMKATEHCAAVAQREGMWAWLYDEDNWPSGTVGPRLVREHPEFRMSQLIIADEEELKKGQSIDRELKSGDELFCVLAVAVDDGQVSAGRTKDLTRQVRKGRLSYTASRAHEKVLVFARVWFRGTFTGGYLDTLSKTACQWFIQETHEKYAERVKKYLGRSIKGIFTDEPSTCYCNVGRSIQFTPELPKRFEKEHGISLADALPALFFEAGPQTPKIRLALHSTLKEMYMEAFFRPIYQWCEKHKIRSIGHVNTEGELADQVKQQLDYFASAGEMHYAGVDTLFDTTFRKEGYTNNHVACKLASSAEHLLQRERAMAEAFGVAAGWDINLPTLKWLADFQAVMGINYFMPHASYYSLAGFRKWECPPDHSYHSAYWPFYKYFADHMARLSAVLHGGRHIAPVAVLSPVAAVAANLDPATNRKPWAQVCENTSTKEITDTYDCTVETLSRHQMDFDLLNEDILQRSAIGKDGTLEVRGAKGKVIESFRALVLPSAQALSQKTAELIGQWARDGLTVVFVEAMPSMSPEKGQDARLAQQMSDLLALPNVFHAPAADAEMIRELKSRVEPDIDVGEARDILYLMKDKESRRVVLVVNTNRDSGFERLRVRVRATGAVHLLDTLTGELTVVQPVSQDDEWTELDLDLPPASSQLLMFSRRRLTRQMTPPPMVSIENQRLPLADSWQFTAEGGNYLPLPRWQLEISGSHGSRNWALFSKRYSTRFYAAISPGRAVLLADGLFDQLQIVNNVQPEVRISLNGHLLQEWREGTHYDRLVPECDVTSLVRQGMNEVVIESASNFRSGLNVDQPLYIAGDFTVAGQGENEVMSVATTSIQTGNWAHQGFPYFSGIGRYEQEFELPAELAGERIFLELEKVAYSVEVLLNGKKVAALPWAPYVTELTDYLRPGRNLLTLRIANTMTNLFVQTPQDSGLMGRVSLVTRREM